MLNAGRRPLRRPTRPRRRRHRRQRPELDRLRRLDRHTLGVARVVARRRRPRMVRGAAGQPATRKPSVSPLTGSSASVAASEPPNAPTSTPPAAKYPHSTSAATTTMHPRSTCGPLPRPPRPAPAAPNAAACRSDHGVVQVPARLRVLLHRQIGNTSTFANSRSSLSDHAGDPFATAILPPHRSCNSFARSHQPRRPPTVVIHVVVTGDLHHGCHRAPTRRPSRSSTTARSGDTSNAKHGPPDGLDSDIPARSPRRRRNHRRRLLLILKHPQALPRKIRRIHDLQLPGDRLLARSGSPSPGSPPPTPHGRPTAPHATHTTRNTPDPTRYQPDPA